VSSRKRSSLSPGASLLPIQQSIDFTPKEASCLMQYSKRLKLSESKEYPWHQAEAVRKLQAEQRPTNAADDIGNNTLLNLLLDCNSKFKTIEYRHILNRCLINSPFPDLQFSGVHKRLHGLEARIESFRQDNNSHLYNMDSKLDAACRPGKDEAAHSQVATITQVRECKLKANLPWRSANECYQALLTHEQEVGKYVALQLGLDHAHLGRDTCKLLLDKELWGHFKATTAEATGSNHFGHVTAHKKPGVAAELEKRCTRKLSDAELLAVYKDRELRSVGHWFRDRAYAVKLKTMVMIP